MVVEVQTFPRLSWISMGAAVVHASIGIAIAVVGTAEGWVGGVLYALMYALPLLLIAAALRASRRSWRLGAGWAALAMAACYTLVAIGNWSGYSQQQAIFVVAITAPTVALDLGIFSATVMQGLSDRRRLLRRM